MVRGMPMRRHRGRPHPSRTMSRLWADSFAERVIALAKMASGLVTREARAWGVFREGWPSSI